MIIPRTHLEMSFLVFTGSGRQPVLEGRAGEEFSVQYRELQVLF